MLLDFLGDVSAAKITRSFFKGVLTNVLSKIFSLADELRWPFFSANNVL